MSRTSQAVALTRAGMSRPHTPQGDPGAQARLCAGMRPLRRPRAGILARTRFFDDQVLAAISAGVGQVVICGAGYDDRALRFRSPGVRFFELDHPATQADKLRRLRDMDADLRDVVLAPAGRPRARPTPARAARGGPVAARRSPARAGQYRVVAAGQGSWNPGASGRPDATSRTTRVPSGRESVTRAVRNIPTAGHGERPAEGRCHEPTTTVAPLW